MEMLFELTLAGKLRAFMPSFELIVNMCTAVCALKSMPSVKHPPLPPPRTMSVLHLNVVNYFFPRSPRALFTTMLLLLSFRSGEWMYGELCGVAALYFAFSTGEATSTAVDRDNHWLW